jgi:hypothetical protein
MASKTDIGALQAQLARLSSVLTAAELEEVIKLVKSIINRRGN